MSKPVRGGPFSAGKKQVTGGPAGRAPRGRDKDTGGPTKGFGGASGGWAGKHGPEKKK